MEKALERKFNDIKHILEDFEYAIINRDEQITELENDIERLMAVNEDLKYELKQFKEL